MGCCAPGSPSIRASIPQGGGLGPLTLVLSCPHPLLRWALGLPPLRSPLSLCFTLFRSNKGGSGPGGPDPGALHRASKLPKLGGWEEKWTAHPLVSKACVRFQHQLLSHGFLLFGF